MTKFKLVNPHIEGSLKTTFTADSNINAAQNAWKTLSEHILNNVPKFAFTLENTSDGCLCHFLVQEKMNKKKAKYTITELNLQNNDNIEKAFKKNFENFKKKKIMAGGKHKDKKDDDDSSSSSSDSDSPSIYDKIFYKNVLRKSYPINFVWYDPLFYKLDYIVTPTWVIPGTTYVPPTVLEVTDVYLF
jgi:hypothetical protein